jgi:branched-chain amino acid transport system substrate-binding protein
MKKKFVLGLLLLVPVFTSCLLIFPSLAAPNEPEQLDPIKIGMFLPVSFGYNYYGEWARQGFELGLKYATNNTNATAAGREYELHYYDTLGDYAAIGGIVTSAIETDNLDIIFGGASSAVAANMIPVAKQYEKLYFVGPAADAEITGALFDKHTFRVSRNSYHDAVAGIYHSMDVLGAKNIAFLAMDYSFGYSGVGAMSQEVAKRGGKVVDIQYAPFHLAPPVGHFTPYLLDLIDTAQTTGIDMLHIIWAGSFTELITDVWAQNVFNYMNVSWVAIDIISMNILEAALTPPATIIGGQGLCLYGYQLPNNPVNDWMVQQHIDQNIMPNLQYFGQTYRVPELFTASAFGSAQFIVNVTNTVPDLNIDYMIAHLEGLNITCPKGPTYMRPNDHQGLAEMYIADVVNDTDPSSETYKQVIAKLNQTIPALACAPPVTTNYEPYPEDFTVIYTTVMSTVISGTTIIETIIQTSVSILRTPGFGIVAVLIGVPTALYYRRRKK